ncbi:unnamed protein product [Amoebophrya sp. A25]|nr:unnamed protein product [Amoebophrya sp. A25]|eukprot:GSA25T00012659001.1
MSRGAFLLPTQTPKFDAPDPLRTQCVGDGASNGRHLRVGRRQRFRIQLHRTGDGRPCAQCSPDTSLRLRFVRIGASAANSGSVPVTVRPLDESRACFLVEYSAPLPGLYRLECTLTGEQKFFLRKSSSSTGKTQDHEDLQLQVHSGEATAQNSRVEKQQTSCSLSSSSSTSVQYENKQKSSQQDLLHYFKLSQVNRIIVQGVDSFGNLCTTGGDPFAARASAGIDIGTVVDLENGKYVVEYVPDADRFQPPRLFEGQRGLANKAGQGALLSSAAIEVLLHGEPVTVVPLKLQPPGLSSKDAFDEDLREVTGTTTSRSKSPRERGAADDHNNPTSTATAPPDALLVSVDRLIEDAERTFPDPFPEVLAQGGAHFAAIELDKERKRLENFRATLKAHQSKLFDLARSVQSECRRAAQERAHVQVRQRALAKQQAQLEAFQQTLTEKANSLAHRESEMALQLDLMGMAAEIENPTDNQERSRSPTGREQLASVANATSSLRHREHALKQKEDFVAVKIQRLEQLEREMRDAFEEHERSRNVTQWHEALLRHEGSQPQNDTSPKDDQDVVRIAATVGGRIEAMRKRREERYAREMEEHRRAVSAPREDDVDATWDVVPGRVNVVLRGGNKNGKAPPGASKVDTSFLNEILRASPPKTAQSSSQMNAKDVLAAPARATEIRRSQIEYFEPSQMRKKTSS